MGALAIAPTLLDELFREAETKPAPVGGERTLDDTIVGAWEALAAHLSPHCPLCDAEMVPVYGAHSRPVAGRCCNCGTTLS
jgi:hypothetical protein